MSNVTPLRNSPFRNVTPSALRQAAYRVRRESKYQRMEAALRQIEAKLDGTEKPAALAILEIVRGAL